MMIKRIRLALLALVAPLLLAGSNPVPSPPATGGGAPTTLQDLRALFDEAIIIDANPAEPGSTSAGIQEAINQCPSGGSCIVQLRANTTYTLSTPTGWPAPAAGAGTAAIQTNGGDYLWIRGFGDSSLLTFTHLAGDPSTTENKMIAIEPGSTNIQLSDFRINRTDQCSVNCQSYSQIVYIVGDVSNVVARNLTITSSQVAHDGAYAGRNVWPFNLISYPDETPANSPKNVAIVDNRITMSSAAIHSLDCWGCIFSRNRITTNAPDDDNGATIRAMTIFSGAGYVIEENTIDLSMDGRVTEPSISCFVLSGDQVSHGASQAGRINSGALVKGNHCRGLRQTNAAGIRYNGYSNASVNGNVFSAGVCSNDALRSCESWEDCGGSTANSCNGAPAKAYYFDVADWASAGQNQKNHHVGNTFYRGTACAVQFNAHANDANANIENSFQAETWDLTAAAFNGICGNSGKWGKNFFQGISIPAGIVGYAGGAQLSGTQCVAGLGAGTECMIAQRPSDSSISIEKLIPFVHSYFPGTPVAGEIMVAVNDPYPGACKNTGGGQRSFCHYNGSAWIGLNSQPPMFLPTTRCAGATGTLLWDTRATNAPAPVCTAGATETTLMRGTADFDDATDEEIQIEGTVGQNFSTAAAQTSQITLDILWRTANTANEARWCAQTVCRAPGTELDDGVWDTDVVCVDDTVEGVANRVNTATLSLTTAAVSTCAAGELLHLRIYRDADHANDDLVGDASVIGVRISGVGSMELQ